MTPTQRVRPLLEIRNLQIAYGAKGKLLFWRKEPKPAVWDASFTLAEGEAISTEHSHKYSVDQFTEIAADAGFSLRRHWSDDKSWCGVLYFEVS